MFAYIYNLHTFCEPHACSVHRVQMREVGFPGTQVTDSCELLWMLEPKPRSSIRMEALLTSKSSFHPDLWPLLTGHKEEDHHSSVLHSINYKEIQGLVRWLSG